MRKGWTETKSGMSYSYPTFKWYQFRKKRRWVKFMSQFSAGERIKL